MVIRKSTLSGSLTRPSSANWMAFCGLSVASSITVAFLVSARNLLCGLRSCRASVNSGSFEIVGLNGRQTRECIFGIIQNLFSESRLLGPVRQVVRIGRFGGFQGA